MFSNCYKRSKESEKKEIEQTFIQKCNITKNKCENCNVIDPYQNNEEYITYYCGEKFDRLRKYFIGLKVEDITSYEINYVIEHNCIDKYDGILLKVFSSELDKVRFILRNNKLVN